MRKTVIATDKAPGAIGPYSQGIAAGGFIYVSGQLPVDMATGELETRDIRKAARCSLDNLRAVLEQAGASMADVVKTTVFLVNMDDFSAVNEVYASYFSEDPPARSCVAAASLPKGVGIEIEAVAVKNI